MQILLLDDDEDLLELMARRFEKKGCIPFCAKNIAAAEDILHAKKDLAGIVSDLFLGQGENGLSFYESNVLNKRHIKFVLATGDRSGDPRIPTYINDSPLFICVEKPYSLEEVIEFFQT